MNVATPSERSRPLALVTGVQGFTGAYLAQELREAGYEVAGLTHDGGENAASVDLCDRQVMAEAIARIQPDVVVHLAAIAFVAHGDVDAIYRTNIIGTRNLLEALAANAHRPRAVLLASSANVYGNSEVELLTEAVPPAPANHYAVSKLAMEHMAALWKEKLPIIVVRPFNYTGVGQSEKFLLPKIVNHFRRRAPLIELGNIDVARDFQDVRFVANAYRRLLDADAIGQTVNLCSGRAHTLTEVVRMVEDLAGYKIEVKVNPAFVRANEVAKLTGSNRKLAELIGPLDIIPLRDTLQWMYEARD
jgi:nucleoside-diphosphate-sugar epimerase